MKYEGEANLLFKKFEDDGLVKIVCGCGYKCNSVDDLFEHSKTCESEHQDIYLGHK